MLQRARRMKRDLQSRGAGRLQVQPGVRPRELPRDHHADIAVKLRNARGLVRVRRVVARATGRNRGSSCRSRWRSRPAPRRRARSAATRHRCCAASAGGSAPPRTNGARGRRSTRPPPATSEMPRRSSTRAAAALIPGAATGLYAAGEHQHASLVARRGPCGRRHGLPARCAVRVARHQPTQCSREPDERARSASVRKGTVASNRAPQQPLAQRAGHHLLDMVRGRYPAAARNATPDGQVVSHARQVRQRSRCSCVAREGSRRPPASP